MRSSVPHSNPQIARKRMRMDICREFGWTLEEYDNAPAHDIDEIAIMLEEESINRKREHEIEMGKARIHR